MHLRYIPVIAAALCAMSAAGQSAFDVYSLSQPDLRGTARFMAMGGAFTALGGDLSTMTQNPGGIGIYRNSEIGITLDIDMQRATTGDSHDRTLTTQTKVLMPNVGYIGSARLGNGIMPYINWGVSYGRTASFDRCYRGTMALSSSMTNYVADRTAHAFGERGGWPTDALGAYDANYDPFGMDPTYGNGYGDAGYPAWISVLLFNSGAITPTTPGSTDYAGLYDDTPGFGTFDVVERGHADEFTFTMGGNLVNQLYWGIGVGVVTVDYSNETYYTEAFDNALVARNSSAGGRTHAKADLGLYNYKHLYGSGANIKFGLIYRPINALRIGVAVHTPTWLGIHYEGNAATDFRYRYPGGDIVSDAFPNVDSWGGIVEDPDYTYDYFKMRTIQPWRFMAGIAAVIGNKAIISADYEMRAMSTMTVKDQWGDVWEYETQDVKTYYRDINMLRVGAEYRVTPQLSLRAGYSYQSSPVKQELENQNVDAYTFGANETETLPSFVIDNSTQYITAGLGWAYKNFYANAAYVHRQRASRWQAWSSWIPYDGTARQRAPQVDLHQADNRIVLSIGVRW